MNMDYLIDEVLAQVAPEGEENTGIYRWQIALLVPDAVRQLVTEIASGVYPIQQNPMKNTGVSGQMPDISSLQSQLKRNFIIPITGEGSTSLAPALSGDEPMLLIPPFHAVRHVSVTSKLSIWTPDVEEVEQLGNTYENEAIVYSVDEYEFEQDGELPDSEQEEELWAGNEVELNTEIPVAKRLTFSPSTLTGNLTVTSFYVPKIENLPDAFKPFVMQMLIAALIGGRNAKGK